MSQALAFDTIVVFNEVQYHPAGTTPSSLEFVEIHSQNAVDIDLSGWRISGEIDYAFPDGTIINGGERLVIAADPSALESASGESGFLGPFTGTLSNNSATLRIRNNNDRIMDELTYDDRSPWPIGADGSGATLSKINPKTASEPAYNWKHSLEVGGTPGNINFTPTSENEHLPLTINEIAGTLNSTFWIELHNSGGSDINLEGFIFSFEDAGEYQFPTGQSIPANDFLLIPSTTLALSTAPIDGENLYLYQPGKATLIDAVRIDDLPRGRFPDGSDQLLTIAQAADESPGAANNISTRSDIVINEIMYHHRPNYSNPSASPATEYSESNEEWIELYNPSPSTVSLSNWEFTGAIEFTFPAGTQILSGGYLVIARDLADFSEKFPGITALGDFSGSLANSNDRLFLIDQFNNPVDEVSYYDGSPWPDAADGGGSSLELRHPELNNNAASSWAASDNSATSQWKTYSYNITAHTPVYAPAQFNFHELRLGLLDSGEILIDDFSVIEAPNGANLELIENGDFADASGWRLLGTHQLSEVINDSGNNALKIVASGRSSYLHNLIETNFTNNGSLREIISGTDYLVSFRAKWLSGSPQLRFEAYYNRFAELVIVDQPETHGTPGSQNSTYSTAVGPTLSNLLHQPAVPAASDSITISVDAEDPNGVNSMTLKYSVNAGVFQSTPMSSSDGKSYSAIIPAQPNDALIHFYVEALDSASNLSYAPPHGPDSRAIIKVTTPNSGGNNQSIRLNMLAAEANAMHVEQDILDNLRRRCTIIIDEADIAYDSAIRLRGSMFSRRRSNAGFSLKLPSDKPYRGTHGTITLRKGDFRREIVIKHLINAAGGLHDNYNDIVQFNAHLSTFSGPSRLEMTRFGSDYLKGLPGGKGEDGTVFKMEGIREFQATQDDTPDTPKLPFPIGFINEFDLADQGDDKENYRHNLRINTGLDRDDYDGLIKMAKFFSLSDTALEEAAPDAVNVDMWTRQFAMLALCGVRDTYSHVRPHNLNFYTRPGYPAEPMPWDWDSHFVRSTTAPIWGNRNVAKLFERPIYSRIYHGQIHDLITRTFNTTYVTPWFNHFSTFTGEDYTSGIEYVTSRASYILDQLPTEIPFTITSNGGNDFDHDGSTVTLTGDAWINAREIIINGDNSPLPITWLDAESWEINIPILPGANPLTITALDFQGNPAGTDHIIITNTSTSTIIPASSANFVVSEIHYQPATNEFEEFIELQNIHPSSSIDLSGVTFTEGIDFEFPLGTLLAPGERILVIRDLEAFQAKYGSDLNVAGVFANLTKLSNGGERIRLETPGGLVIQDFTYDDALGWPTSPDGDGPSLILIYPSANPNHTVATNWRTNTVFNGTPGTTDASTFSGHATTDTDTDGFVDLIEYALGSNPTNPHSKPTFEVTQNGASIVLSLDVLTTADDVIITPQFSTNLQNWSTTTTTLFRSHNGDGTDTLTYRHDNSSPVPTGFARIFAELR